MSNFPPPPIPQLLGRSPHSSLPCSPSCCDRGQPRALVLSQAPPPLGTCRDGFFLSPEHRGSLTVHDPPRHPPATCPKWGGGGVKEGVPESTGWRQGGGRKKEREAKRLSAGGGEWGAAVTGQGTGDGDLVPVLPQLWVTSGTSLPSPHPPNRPLSSSTQGGRERTRDKEPRSPQNKQFRPPIRLSVHPSVCSGRRDILRMLAP